jgi:dihydroxy-acid dehydratase
VLHACPEAAAGGPLAAVRDGDMIALDVANRTLHLEIGDAELAERMAQWVKPDLPARGWWRLYVEHVMGANVGADLDFLVGKSGAPVPRHSH